MIRCRLPLAYVFGFCNFFKKITKSLEFELDLRTTNRKQDILYETLGDNNVNVTVNSTTLYIPSIIPNTETQVFY